MTLQNNSTQMKIRLPDNERKFIAEEAVKNMRSMNAEIVLSIRQRMNAAGVLSPNSAPAAESNNTANGGGASIIKQKDC